MMRRGSAAVRLLCLSKAESRCRWEVCCLGGDALLSFCSEAFVRYIRGHGH